MNDQQIPGMVKMTALKTRPMPQSVAMGREFWAPGEYAPIYAADGWALLGWASEAPAAAGEVRQPHTDDLQQDRTEDA
jgi:hypothetical protein